MHEFPNTDRSLRGASEHLNDPALSATLIVLVMPVTVLYLPLVIPARGR